METDKKSPGSPGDFPLFPCAKDQPPIRGGYGRDASRRFVSYVKRSSDHGSDARCVGRGKIVVPVIKSARRHVHLLADGVPHLGSFAPEGGAPSFRHSPETVGYRYGSNVRREFRTFERRRASGGRPTRVAARVGREHFSSPRVSGHAERGGVHGSVNVEAECRRARTDAHVRSAEADLRQSRIQTDHVVDEFVPRRGSEVRRASGPRIGVIGGSKRNERRASDGRYRNDRNERRRP